MLCCTLETKQRVIAGVLYFTLLYVTLIYFTLIYFTLIYFTLLYFTLLYPVSTGMPWTNRD